MRESIFYGWVILGIAIIAQAMTAPGQTVGVSEFKHLFAEQLGISDRSLALYYCYGTALGSLGLPLFGYLIDRMGCRFAMMLVAMLFGCTCLLAGYASTSSALIIVFTLLRMLGQGALTLVASTMVSYWFQRRLAFAYSIMSVGLGAAMMSVPYIFKPLFQAFDLVLAFQLISLAIFLLIPIAYFLIVDKPHLMGLAQDGDRRPIDQSSSSLSPQNKKVADESDSLEQVNPNDFSFGEALATRSFWIVTAAQSAWALIGTGLVFNRREVFTALSASEFITDLAVPALFAAVIAGQILTGLFARHFQYRSLFCVGGVGMSAACALILCGTAEAAFAGFAVFGFSQGIFIVMGQSLWADFYGRAHIGKIRGLVWMLVVSASSLGGFALTLGEDPQTQFLPIKISMAVMLGLAVCCLWINKPTKQTNLAGNSS